ncbi:MAG: hypothetical protein QOH08_1275 [Chloroflexota bacterium]|jgi:hypothetical protein|nr:hypothetical protein [Chloroflexota bacterium]
MEALDYVAFGSFVMLAIAWVVLPLRAPAVITPAVITPAVELEAAAA